MRLFHSSHLANFIPLLLKQDKEKLRAEVQGTVVSAILDGTTHNGEALAVVLRFVKEGKIEQTLVCSLLLAKSVNGEELDGKLLSVLYTGLGVTQSQLLACMRDGTSVNSKAMATLTVM